MALIKCPECGKEISDKAAACPNCGCPISNEVLSVCADHPGASGNVDNSGERSSVKKKRGTFFVFIIAIVALATCVLGRLFLLPELKYQKAANLYEEDKYKLAYDAFTSIQNYKNAQVFMKYCVYQQAVKQFNGGNYKEAISLFQQCKDIEDTDEMVDKCNYFLAEKSFSEGDYDTAINLLRNNSYSACEELIDKCNYQLAEKSFAEGDYVSAIELLTDNSYSESDALLEKCNVEKEKNEKSDYAFLADLEKSILRRMEINAKEQHDYDQLVGTELAYVEKYYNAAFYDANLKKLAKKYIDGLKKQKKALSEFYAWDYQEEWYNGLVDRCEVLNELYKQYDFLKDDKDFVGEYVYKLDYWKKWLKAFNELETMMNKQYAEENRFKKDNNYWYVTFTNTTKYTYTNQMDFWIYNYDGDTLIDTVSVVTKDIHPGDSFTVKVYVREYNDWWLKEYGNWYPEIQIP